MYWINWTLMEKKTLAPSPRDLNGAEAWNLERIYIEMNCHQRNIDLQLIYNIKSGPQHKD